MKFKMLFKTISLKVVIISILATLGVLAASIAVFESFAFKEAANTAQLRTLSRAIGISSDEIMRQTVNKLSDVAAGAQRDRGFKKAVKKLIKDTTNDELKAQTVEFLNEQFRQKSVTTGIIDLKKVRIYDTKFNFVAESSEGLKGYKPELPASILDRAKPREKSERLKILNSTWLSKDGAMLSVLAPVGGLRLLAYMEIIVNPVNNMKEIQEMMGLPIRIVQVSGDISFESETWAERVSDTTLAVEYALVGQGEERALKIFALEELAEMYDDMAKTEYLVATVFAIVFGLGLIVALFTLKQTVFKPIELMVRDMERIAAGDMRVDASTNSIIREIQFISVALKQIVQNLNSKMLDIREIGVNLSGFSSELSVQANRALDNAKQQLADVDQLSVATNELVYSMGEVESNAKSTAESSKGANEIALKGSAVVHSAENSIRSVSTEVENGSQAINKLQSDVSDVGAILSTIQNIAEQTNLLALNAAIEAARAGENGRGFAVVADEVRTLANRTQEATREVNRVLEELVSGAKQATEAMSLSQEKVNESVTLAVDAKKSLDEITEHVAQITEMNMEIEKAAKEQSTVSEENNARISHINSLANQVSGDAESLTQRSSSLLEMASKLDKLVDTFKLRA